MSAPHPPARGNGADSASDPQPAGGDVACAAAGEHASVPVLAELVELYSGALFAYAFRLAGNAADAEDLTQEAFLVAQQKLHQVRDGQAALGWLLAVLRSCFTHSLRKRQPSLSEVDLAETAIVDSGEPAWVDQEQLQQALAGLPEEFRVVVLMFYFEELSYKQIAAELELPIGTVMSRLSRAKSQLRTALESSPVRSRSPHPLPH